MAKKSPSLADIRSQLRELSDPDIAQHSRRFFKTGRGQYGEGDKFIGVRVPVLRQLARQNRRLPLNKTSSLLKSPIHEERLLALLLLVRQYEKGDPSTQKSVFDFYLQNLEYVNNWDLVDCSAHKIIGDFLRYQSRKLLYRLAKSSALWDRRIAIMSTLAFIYDHDFDDTLAIAESLLSDEEDLIHKAVGWMLREVGNRNRKVEEAFLKEHYAVMPRTMLRYAIEKFPVARRKRYLAGTI